MTNTPIDHLRAACGGEGPAEARNAPALRLRVRLQPAGGAGSKVMPPTYAGQDERGRTKASYVVEERVIDGEKHPCTLLDGVASQANRMEESLEEDLNSDSALELPRVLVNQGIWGLHSALAFPHRVFDAHVEDALLEGTRFGDTDVFRSLATVTRKKALPVMERFPVALVLGGWASRAKDPQGATRLARLLTSEIIAVGSQEGERIASRIDPHPISNAVDVYEAPGSRFTLDEAEARKDEKGNALKFRGEGRAGRPSQAGYGNVAPTLAAHGGITMLYGLQIATFSLAGLRECRFGTDGAADVPRDVAGRVMLAALGVRLLDLLLDRGYDLRSGCLLIPEAEPSLELVGRLGSSVHTWPLGELDSEDLLQGAVEEGREAGIDWRREPLELMASPQQLALLEASQEQPDVSGE